MLAMFLLRSLVKRKKATPQRLVAFSALNMRYISEETKPLTIERLK
jgi:hypothetical protein